MQLKVHGQLGINGAPALVHVTVMQQEIEQEASPMALPHAQGMRLMLKVVQVSLPAAKYYINV